MSRKSDPFDVELTPELIIRAYQAGIFPMAEDADSPDLFWVSPQRRGILPLDGLHVSRSLRKTLRTHSWSVPVSTRAISWRTPARFSQLSNSSSASSVPEAGSWEPTGESCIVRPPASHSVRGGHTPSPSSQPVRRFRASAPGMYGS